MPGGFPGGEAPPSDGVLQGSPPKRWIKIIPVKVKHCSIGKHVRDPNRASYIEVLNLSCYSKLLGVVHREQNKNTVLYKHCTLKKTPMSNKTI